MRRSASRCASAASLSASFTCGGEGMVIELVMVIEGMRGVSISV